MKGVSFSDPFYSGSVHIVSGQIASGTTGTAGTLLQIDKDTGCFTVYDFSQPVSKTGTAYVAVDDIDTDTQTARVLMSGMVATEKIHKADGSTLSVQERARLQSYSANIIYY
jgi:hypothetical protein